MSLLVVIQEIMIIFPIILFVLWKILICCSKFVPILLKEAYGILELVNAAGVLYLGISYSGRGNFDYCIGDRRGL